MNPRRCWLYQCKHYETHLGTDAAAVEIEHLQKPAQAGKWAGLDPTASHQFCRNVEELLKEWAWNGNCPVEFDENSFDVPIDGTPQQSHGKGVRAILYAAFVIGLLRYCDDTESRIQGLL